MCNVCACSFLLTKARAYFFLTCAKRIGVLDTKISLLGKTKTTQKEPPPRQITRSYMSLSSSSSSLLGHEARRLLRGLLRARLALFHGDEKALQASAIEIRSHFDQHKDIANEEEIRKRIKEGKEAEMFLTTNVLQGKMNERGNFETKLKSADPDKETWEVPKEAK